MITGHIKAEGLVRMRVIKIDRWRKRVLIQTWVHNANEPPVRRWYKEAETHHQTVTFKVD